jgi:hypothetical protein
MRPNLSLNHITAALTAFGTTAILAGCAGSEPPAAAPVQSVEVTPTSAPATVSAAAATAPSTSVAAGASATVGTPATTTPAVTTTVTTPSVTATVTTPAVTTPAVAATGPAKPKAPMAATKKANAQASCGAGTCSASK